MICRSLWLVLICLVVQGCQTTTNQQPGWQQQAKAHLQRQDYDAAWMVLQQQHQHGRKEKTLFLLSDTVLHARKDAAGQLNNANEGLLWYPRSSRLRLGKARALSALSRFADAEAALRQIPAGDVDAQLLKLIVRLDISTRRGDRAAVQALMQQAETLRPGISKELREQRMRQARPAPTLPDSDGNSVFATHPSWQQRVQQIESQIRSTSDVESN